MVQAKQLKGIDISKPIYVSRELDAEPILLQPENMPHSPGSCDGLYNLNILSLLEKVTENASDELSKMKLKVQIDFYTLLARNEAIVDLTKKYPEKADLIEALSQITTPLPSIVGIKFTGDDIKKHTTHLIEMALAGDDMDVATDFEVLSVCLMSIREMREMVKKAAMPDQPAIKHGCEGHTAMVLLGFHLIKGQFPELDWITRFMPEVSEVYDQMQCPELTEKLEFIHATMREGISERWFKNGSRHQKTQEILKEYSK